MKRRLAGAAFAIAAILGTLSLGSAPAQADDDGSCVWYEDGDEYPEGTQKEEYWGVETRPDGRAVYRYRVFRCAHGAWWYEGSTYYPVDRDDDDDDEGDGHTEILT